MIRRGHLETGGADVDNGRVHTSSTLFLNASTHGTTAGFNSRLSSPNANGGGWSSHTAASYLPRRSFHTYVHVKEYGDRDGSKYKSLEKEVHASFSPRV